MGFTSADIEEREREKSTVDPCPKVHPTNLCEEKERPSPILKALERERERERETGKDRISIF